jgi:hypothetical protein
VLLLLINRSLPLSLLDVNRKKIVASREVRELTQRACPPKPWRRRVRALTMRVRELTLGVRALTMRVRGLTLRVRGLTPRACPP